jgi:hypothetical protein
MIIGYIFNEFIKNLQKIQFFKANVMLNFAAKILND